MSHVGISFQIPQYSLDTNSVGTLNVLESVRNTSKRIRIYNASTSEMFGGEKCAIPTMGYNEISTFNPKSPYGVGKVAAYHISKVYRDSYNMHISSGFLFNHTSPRRGRNFVCRKITSWVSKYVDSIINKKEIEPLILGNLDSYRDFGHSKDYIEAQWLMLQQTTPDDYVISSGETYSIRQILQVCFSMIGKKIEWDSRNGKDNEIGTCENRVVVKVSPTYYRPLEVDYLLGDSSKARRVLGWLPKYNVKSIFKEMVEHDCNEIGITKEMLDSI